MRRLLRRYKYTASVVLLVLAAGTLAVVYGHGSLREAGVAGMVAGLSTLVSGLRRRRS